MLHTIVFIGRSGCGKGTQADLLKNHIARLDSDKHQILYVETGERFRRFIGGESFSSKLSKEIYEKDERQPDFLACLMWASMLSEELEPGMHLVFDGAPRSHTEAALLTTALKFYQRTRPTIIYLNVSRKWSEDRLLSRGRQDDRTLQKINKRLDWFEADTWPAVEYFKTNNFYRFLEIDGEQPIKKVHADIIAAYDQSS
ncbi:MAG: nucleoside monophosphate kinase [bacterium]|nr:nucleoside monophosphate kinase [bacterium]